MGITEVMESRVGNRLQEKIMNWSSEVGVV